MEKRKQDYTAFCDFVDSFIAHEVSISTLDAITDSLIGKNAAEADRMLVEYTRMIEAGELK